MNQQFFTFWHVPYFVWLTIHVYIDPRLLYYYAINIDEECTDLIDISVRVYRVFWSNFTIQKVCDLGSHE